MRGVEKGRGIFGQFVCVLCNHMIGISYIIALIPVLHAMKQNPCINQGILVSACC